MAELPADRVRPGRAFEAAGVDYAGPFQIKHLDKDGSLVSLEKSWIAVFVCMKTRAVHLDVVPDLTSNSFIACYERFVARRGHCYKMFSDNGTSFVGAEKEIARAYLKWRADGILDEIGNRNTEWKFMTPAAPHQGGIYEGAVKSMKFHMKRIIGAKTNEYNQFQTLLCGIEAVLNSRPIAPLTDDPNDYQALTPGHFIIGEPLIAPPAFRYLNENKPSERQMWAERIKMMENFWIRWKEEYLVTLQERKKWRRQTENVKVGQMVVMRDENSPPTHWRLGRIVELLPGQDGLVRNVVVKTEKGAFKRPIQKLSNLPVDSAETPNENSKEG